MNIGIDLDEVLGYYLPAFIEWHNITYKTKWKIEEFNSYYAWEIYNFTKEQGIQNLYDFHKTEYFKNIKPADGAKTILEELKKNHELYIITSRQDSIVEETKNWVNRHFPNIFSEIYFANHFSQSGKPKTKKEICDYLKIDVFIEDSLIYASECLTSDRKIFLFDYPWNQTDNLPKNIKRIKSWNEINI